MGNKHAEERKPSKPKTPTFLLELPLVAEAGQAAHLRAQLEAGRQLYNAILSEGQTRLRRMRADPAWQAARAIPRTHKQDTIIIEKLSYRGWQKRYGSSVGLRAPGLLIDHLKRTVASTGGTLHEVPTRMTKLSQFCQRCAAFVPKPLSQRWHQCACGIGPVQRDLYSAFLAAYLDPADPIPSCARYVVRLLKVRRRAWWQHTSERKNARKRGRSCPEAWVFLVPERVCPKVEANPHQSQLARSGEQVWKRGRNVRTLAA
jgi:hypothetical protein